MTALLKYREVAFIEINIADFTHSLFLNFGVLPDKPILLILKLPRNPLILLHFPYHIHIILKHSALLFLQLMHTKLTNILREILSDNDGVD